MFWRRVRLTPVVVAPQLQDATPTPPPTPPPTRPVFEAATEWPHALDLASHQDELLLKLRAFTLPLLIAVIMAGAGFATTIDRVFASRWLLIGLCIVAAVKVIGLGLLAFFAGAPGYRSGRWLARVIELIPFLALAACFGIWAGFIYDRDPASFSVAGPVLLLGSVWLLLLYLIDRLYYTPRLLGAADRVDALEEMLSQEDGWPARSTNKARWTDSLLPLALYFVPILILANAGLAIIAFGGDDKASTACKAGVTLELRNGQLALGLDSTNPAQLSNCIGGALPLLPLLQPRTR